MYNFEIKLPSRFSWHPGRFCRNLQSEPLSVSTLGVDASANPQGFFGSPPLFTADFFPLFPLHPQYTDFQGSPRPTGDERPFGPDPKQFDPGTALRIGGGLCFIGNLDDVFRTVVNRRHDGALMGRHLSLHLDRQPHHPFPPDQIPPFHGGPWYRSGFYLFVFFYPGLFRFPGPNTAGTAVHTGPLENAND